MGSDNSAQQAAKRQEAKRQAAITAGTARVNEVFDAPERAAQRDDFIGALRDHYGADLSRQKANADRRLKFSLARGGLTGGSAAIDANQTLGEDFTAGLLDAENRAQGAYADLGAQDEQSRQSLLAMVRSGMDATTAAQRAGAVMRSNAAVAQSGALTQGLGDAFGGTAAIYKQQEEAAARRRGNRDAYGTIYGPQKTWS